MKKRALLLRSVLYELKSQYAGSFFGMFWVIIAPVTLIFIYTIIYLYVLKVKPAHCSTESYVLHLISGLLPYLGFVQSVQKSSSSILQNKAAIYNTLYPIEFIPIRTVIASFVPIIIGVGFLFFYKIFTGHFSLGLLGLLLSLLNLVVFTVGISLMISLIMIGFRDIENILQYLFMILLFVTPIGFFVENLPQKFKILVYINPLYHLISPIQKVVAFDQMYDIWTITYSLIISTLTLYTGSRFFRSFKLTVFELL